MDLPPLPLAEWEPRSRRCTATVRCWASSEWSSRRAATNWWHVTLYVSPRGLTIGPVPHASGTFEASLDLLNNRLLIITSDGRGFEFGLDHLPVAGFYERLFSGLASLGIEASINAKPFDLDDVQRLDANTVHATCDPAYAQRYHRVLSWVDQVFKEFSGRFTGKQSPVQLFWHSFDLALNRFSGKTVTLPEGTDPVTREAYSHEVTSFGFWPGDSSLREPAFYSYTAPEPEGLTDQPLKPVEAYWQAGGTALLTYEALRGGGSPRETLLDFMQSAYVAGAGTAGWDTESLRASR